MDASGGRPRVGELLRGWRSRRRLSQLEVSTGTGISTRHLSFVETGRARPTSALILRLAEHLDVPLRDRNALLLAGGYAPAFPERTLDAPALAELRVAVRGLLSGLDPYPAVVVDRHWQLLDANPSAGLFLADAAAPLRAPPVNVLRLSLHPDGLAPRIANLAQWRAHLLDRLHRQAVATDDPVLRALLDELRAYPCAGPPHRGEVSGPTVPLRYRHGGGELSFISTTTLFGTPRDVTVAELAIESFLPGDQATRSALAVLAAAR
jgi:transcriptional regulator with XRE-family HTH domain